LVGRLTLNTKVSAGTLDLLVHCRLHQRGIGTVVEGQLPATPSVDIVVVVGSAMPIASVDADL
jgi:hypothetical protein